MSILIFLLETYFSLIVHMKDQKPSVPKRVMRCCPAPTKMPGLLEWLLGYQAPFGSHHPTLTTHPGTPNPIPRIFFRWSAMGRVSYSCPPSGWKYLLIRGSIVKDCLLSHKFAKIQRTYPSTPLIGTKICRLDSDDILAQVERDT